MPYIQWKKADNSAYQLNRSVHIWRISFSNFSNEEAALNELLSNIELERASRFHFKIDSLRYKSTKAISKLVLSKILNATPRDLKFSLNKHGKPELLNNEKNIHFNVSHSGDIGLIAVSDIGPIGIDVEIYRKKMLTEKFARRFFSESEVKDYLALSDEQKEEGFFNCWTRKEAFIKALGLGLAMPLKDFDVSMAPNKEAKLKKIRNINEEPHKWILKNIPLFEDYAASFAIKSNILHDKYWLADKNYFNQEPHY